MMQGTAIRDSVCAVLLLLAVALGVTMCMHSAGCSLLQSPETRYTTELLRCVDKATTLAELEACRRVVDVDWGIAQTVRDGGVP